MKQLISLATALLLLSPELASQEKTSLRVDFRLEVAKYRAKLGEGNVAGFEAEMNAALVPTLSHQIGFLSFDASTDDLVLRVSLRDKLEEDAEDKNQIETFFHISLESNDARRPLPGPIGWAFRPADAPRQPARPCA